MPTLAVSAAQPAETIGSLSMFAAARNAGLPPLALDLTAATVVASPAPGPEAKAVAVLIEEVGRRTLRPWPQADRLPDRGPAIVVGIFARVRNLLAAHADTLAIDEAKVATEGYQLATAMTVDGAPLVVVVGKDARGVLYGIGHLLRKLHLGPARAGLMGPLNLASSPRWPLRGHQLGVRANPNSYSGWDPAHWEHYIRELALFGANAIELVPPRSDYPQLSPDFTRPQLDTMSVMSRIADSYGLDVWVWYPALDDDYSKPETVEFALREWAVVFENLPRLDAILIPGGDPGHTPAQLLLPLAEKQIANARRFHPRARVWISPQGFDPPQMDYFFHFLAEKSPDWFAGTVFAPWVNMDLAEFRRRTPARYGVRFYPDITHTLVCQFPVHDWDRAFARTLGREPVCPRPTDMAHVLRTLQPHTVGAICYSEGVNDDANKAVWSALSWDPDADLLEVLRDYGRLFLGERLADDFAQGLLALERNWRGPLAANAGVETTLTQFQAMERAASPSDLWNWRFQLALYRAYYDAHVRRRLLNEEALEIGAMDALRRAPADGAIHAMDAAEAILSRATAGPVALELRTRIHQLAEALFQSIRMKLSVPLYRAVSQPRGANLDSLDWPLNNRPWLEARFAAIRALPEEAARLAEIAEIMTWTDPGPGGFYDDLGKPHLAPRLERGLGYARDPNFIHTVMTTFTRTGGARLDLRTSAQDQAGGVSEVPVILRYTGLDPHSQYQVRANYDGCEFIAPYTLKANGGLLLARIERSAPTRRKPPPVILPRDATASGELTLTWQREAARGGSGRGLVSEVWLEKVPAAPATDTTPHRRAQVH